jgi:hypothetical protein
MRRNLAGRTRVGDFLWLGDSSTMTVPVLSGVLISPVYPPGSNDLNAFSHLGGVPSLPEGMEWPRAQNGSALHFLAQIDLSTLPASGIVDFQGKPLPEFPREGALYFFADCATYALWEQPQAAHRVLYSPTCRGARPLQPPADLAPHNSPEAGVLATTHHPYSPRLTPRPIVLLPHVPVSLTDMPAVLDASRDDTIWPQYFNAPWAGYKFGGDWSRMLFLDTGFPWRWLFLERVAITVHARIKPDWPKDIGDTCVDWFRRTSTEFPLDRIPEALANEFCNWLRSLATRERAVGIDVAYSLADAMIAAWPYVAFSGDLSDFPSGLVQACRPLDRPTEDGYHKMLGNAVSVQDATLADENNILLLRLDTDYPLDYCWGDAGTLQITLPRVDLAARNFERTSLNADCG